MPYVYDFSKLNNINELEVNPLGWSSNLIIVYGYNYVGSLLNFFWKIKNTSHTFRIPVSTLNIESNGNYSKHIEVFLEKFRQDYISWAASGFTESWMREYHNEYKQYIEL